MSFYCVKSIFTFLYQNLCTLRVRFFDCLIQYWYNSGTIVIDHKGCAVVFCFVIKNLQNKNTFLYKNPDKWRVWFPDNLVWLKWYWSDGSHRMLCCFPFFVCVFEAKISNFIGYGTDVMHLMLGDTLDCFMSFSRTIKWLARWHAFLWFLHCWNRTPGRIKPHLPLKWSEKNI